MNFRKLKITANLLLLLVLASCSALKLNEDNQENRGYVTKYSDFTKVQPGITSREEVTKLLGSPVTKSLFGTERWIYAGGEYTEETFFEPEIKNFESFIISFNTSGVVSDVEHKTKGDLREFEVSEDKTLSGGNSLTFFQQLLGNVGRFNNQQKIGAGGGVGR